MAKIKKLLRAVEAAGWQPVETRGTLVQYAHPKRAGRLTLPGQKCSLPEAIITQVMEAAGIKGKGG